ncbi:MAG TPA: hypothetical protein DEB09_01645 [Candidatus Magasanikbacteria bacterium]|nr:hypothetical protein [Candidatus Magasanikbacteria bacterium]
MKLILSTGKYTILGVIISTLVLLSLWKLTNPAWCTGFYLLYLLFFGYYLGQFFLNKEKRIWQIFWGTLGLVGTMTIILSIIYWFYQINREVITFVLILMPILISLQPAPEEDIFSGVETKIDLESYAYIKSYLSTKLLAGVILFGQLLLFATLYDREYSDTIISPWTLLGNNFFIGFFIVSLMLLWVLQKSKHIPTNLLLITTHTGLILSVVLLIFKYGFGFDPHIHEATEKWISQNGFILPKQPYYIGQYVLVVMNNAITHVSIFTLDKILVPVSAFLTMPLALYFGLSRNDFKYKIFPALALVPLIPLTFFIVTTPNNFALLMTLLVSAWIWYENKFSYYKTNFLGIILTLTACAVHAMIGLPLLIIYLGSILFKKSNHSFKLIFYPIYIIILSLIVPLALYANSILNKGSIIFQNTFTHISDFLVIFARPHYIMIDRGPNLLKLLYYYRDALLPIMLIILLAGIIIAIKKYHTKITGFFIATALGLIISAFFIITTIQFKDVISYDQKLYGQRLLDMALIILLPFFVLALREVFMLIKSQAGKQVLASLFFSGLLLVSWFFTYPTRDNISLYTGQNMRSADVQTVHFIANRNNNKTDYIVLSNQIIGVTALREFGFGHYIKTPAGEQYFYSIPTGGPLYQYFRKIVYEEPKREWMEQAMKFAGVKKAYFVHTNYWAPAAEIRDKAKLEADEWWELVDGRVWVFEYVSKE